MRRNMSDVVEKKQQERHEQQRAEREAKKADKRLAEIDAYGFEKGFFLSLPATGPIARNDQEPRSWFLKTPNGSTIPEALRSAVVMETLALGANSQQL
jgi:hypothetical protein